MECCYIACRNAITASDLRKFECHLTRFHQLQTIFITTGVRKSISLPWQHSLLHYILKIKLFGSPNGICSSLTESKHRSAVKEPWRRSNHFNPLPQMVKTISQLVKLAALWRIFRNHGMLNSTISEYASALIDGDVPAILPYRLHDGEKASDDDSDDDDGGPLSMPRALAQVTLAATPGMLDFCWIIETISQRNCRTKLSDQPWCTCHPYRATRISYRPSAIRLCSASSQLWCFPSVTPWVLFQNPSIPLSVSLLLRSKWSLWMAWDVSREDSCKSSLERTPPLRHCIGNSLRRWVWGRHYSWHAGSLHLSLFLIPWPKTLPRISVHPRSLVFTRIVGTWSGDRHVGCQARGRRRKANPWGNPPWCSCSRCPSFATIWIWFSTGGFQSYWCSWFI